MGIWIELMFMIGLNDNLPRRREMTPDTQCKRRYLMEGALSGYDHINDIPIISLSDLTVEDEYKNLFIKVGDQWRVGSLIPQPVISTITFEVKYFKEGIGSLKPIKLEMENILNSTRHDSYYISAKIKE